MVIGNSIALQILHDTTSLLVIHVYISMLSIILQSGGGAQISYYTKRSFTILVLCIWPDRPFLLIMRHTKLD